MKREACSPAIKSKNHTPDQHPSPGNSIQPIFSVAGGMEEDGSSLVGSGSGIQVLRAWPWFFTTPWDLMEMGVCIDHQAVTVAQTKMAVKKRLWRKVSKNQIEKRGIGKTNLLGENGGEYSPICVQAQPDVDSSRCCLLRDESWNRRTLRVKQNMVQFPPKSFP
ncbi:hypothetical protein K402DRAFT_404153 [Aulographum hederae CBS 113979]|uniref:Uncharacterized protein n=1 Tax=Aulographum hederae CBS 113979 TaxID=1176131 RepID=A0A6G1H0Y7_9PEZI|nr:hypothetical protein K402DRAFT_404153 [Aulographum hederae CBS 113979]